MVTSIIKRIEYRLYIRSNLDYFDVIPLLESTFKKRFYLHSELNSNWNYILCYKSEDLEYVLNIVNQLFDNIKIDDRCVFYDVQHEKLKFSQVYKKNIELRDKLTVTVLTKTSFRLEEEEFINLLNIDLNEFNIFIDKLKMCLLNSIHISEFKSGWYYNEVHE